MAQDNAEQIQDPSVQYSLLTGLEKAAILLSSFSQRQRNSFSKT